MSLEANVRAARAVADEASAVAQEPKDTASQAGTDPQVKAASAMYVNAQPLSNTSEPGTDEWRTLKED